VSTASAGAGAIYAAHEIWAQPLVPAIDHSQLSAELARVGVAGVGLMIGPPLTVELAQDHSGAQAAIPR
jgi:hypothetical protein